MFGHGLVMDIQCLDMAIQGLDKGHTMFGQCLVMGHTRTRHGLYNVWSMFGQCLDMG